jgi:hypothetical protein
MSACKDRTICFVNYRKIPLSGTDYQKPVFFASKAAKQSIPLAMADLFARRVRFEK